MSGKEEFVALRAKAPGGGRLPLQNDGERLGARLESPPRKVLRRGSARAFLLEIAHVAREVGGIVSRGRVNRCDVVSCSFTGSGVPESPCVSIAASVRASRSPGLLAVSRSACSPPRHTSPAHPSVPTGVGDTPGAQHGRETTTGGLPVFMGGRNPSERNRRGAERGEGSGPSARSSPRGAVAGRNARHAVPSRMTKEVRT